jgi:hypothetical protein
MTYYEVAEKLGEDYISKPIEFATEADFRIRLHQLLTEYLKENSQPLADVQQPKLVGDTKSYKKSYKDHIEHKLRQDGRLNRVRPEASVDKRRKYDIVCFNEEIKSPIDWVRSGSKRFDENDLDVAFVLKFIKNKCYPPISYSITDDRLLEMDVSELQSVFVAEENSIGKDIKNLNSLPSEVTAIFILISNNNYMFAEPLGEDERDEKKKQRAGLGARQWMQSAAADTGILYIQPYGSKWIVSS